MARQPGAGREALHRLARRCGIEVSYHDVFGELRTASDETLTAVLAALEVDPDGPTPELGTLPEGGGPQRVVPVDEPRWGIFTSVASLRRRVDRGVGTVAHLAQLARWVGDRGASVIAVLPMLATWPEDTSPYSPLSRQAWSERVLELDGLPGLEQRPDLRAVLPPTTSSTGLVAHPDVARATDACVDRVASALAREATVRDAVERFAARRPDLARYAEFRALAEVHGRDWRRWPATTRAATAPVDDDRRFRYLYGQYAVDAQLAGLARDLEDRAQLLALDLPIGCNPAGFDTWAAPHDYALGVSIGAPPDAFARDGQDWGLPPLNPLRVDGSGEYGFRAAVRHHLAHARMLRIDHIMGLHRLWWIPAGFPAARGVYVRYPARIFYDAIVAESRARGAWVVGEDLGTVQPGVRDAMAAHGVMGMWELQFAADEGPDEPLGIPDRPMMASCNTHDMATFAAFWTGDDLVQLAGLGLLDDLDRARARRSEQVGALAHRLGRALGRDAPFGADEGFDAALEFLATSSAAVVTVGLDDLWGETEAQNVPGTVDELRPNWRRRTAVTLEDLDGLDAVARRLGILDAGRRAAGPG